MEKIFLAHLQVEGKTRDYEVVFQDEKYIFTPQDATGDAKSFSFKREENEWIPVEEIDAPLKQQALSELEKYLLSQH